ncbi:MAG: cytochrome c3 family protein [bacterium]|nr:cytochrome c3 family protein [bacterium]
MDQGPFRPSRITVIKRSVVAVSLLIFVGYLISCSDQPSPNQTTNANAAQAQVIPSPAPTIDPSIDYSQFTHKNEAHANLPCALCHKYDGPAPAKIGFPGKANHSPCAGCHVQNFENPTSSQMCSICHTDNTSGSMKQFPRLASFSAKFDHAKHVPQANCATCHKPTQGGQGFSVPSRANAHTTCLQCHAPETAVATKMAAQGSNIDSCSTCHQSGSPGPVQTAAKYVGSFSHVRHKSMNCSSCHTVRPGSGENQVTEPMMAFHRSTGKTLSCATCHNDKRAFGGTDFGDCKRCHQGSSFEF